jgi:hypothetical protein
MSLILVLNVAKSREVILAVENKGLRKSGNGFADKKPKDNSTDKDEITVPEYFNYQHVIVSD